ncbi:MAG: ATP-grasp fold amidoligase family protein, partial [Coriobacteriaceae bacterium]|nr:ATP-grasp fold amidoligase family protein [Coriobacteriaceae bacterium]
LASVSRSVGAAHEGKGSISFFWSDGSRAPFKRLDYPEFSGELSLDASWDAMIAAAETLARAADALFVRADFYCAGGRPYFSELTFYPCGGTMFFDPPEYDRVVGDMLELPLEAM